MRGKLMDNGSFFKQEGTFVDYLFQEYSLFLQLRFFFVASGFYPVAQDIEYEHPLPEFNRIFLFTAGGCRVESADGSAELRPGVIYLLPVDQSFRVTYAGGSSFYFFHLRVLDRTGADVFSGTGGVPELRDHPDLLRDITTAYDSPSIEGDFVWQAAVFRVMCHFLGPSVRRFNERMHLGREFLDLLTYIQDHCTARLKIGKLADRMGRPRETLSREFHRALGVPLKTYITQQVILRARELLGGTDKNVNEVADELGYDDPYYFIRVFKQHTGMTPHRYKTTIRQMRHEA
jgi:AraC-like DNA-binding protein